LAGQTPVNRADEGGNVNKDNKFFATGCWGMRLGVHQARERVGSQSGIKTENHDKHLLPI
jgi:hypothetical protein